ncbi:MAG: translocase [Pelagimonas sp.]|jgi:hypothetical protein|nr:translocase [Pelagimonas sp.]
MAHAKSFALAGATLCCALGIGYFMQYGSQANAPSGPVTLSAIENTSSAAIAPRLPSAEPPQSTDAPAPMQIAARQDAQIETTATATVAPPPSVTEIPKADTCEPALTAYEMAGAMVKLGLDAPCHPGERVTLRHAGMVFTETMGANGRLTLKVPALTKQAAFSAQFLNGDRVTAEANVSALDFYDRVAVQWQGDSGLQLHAREFGAAYFEPGHVWIENAGSLASTALGEGGFLMRLGQADVPDAQHTEVYSFPSGTIERAGQVAMTVELEVTAENCGQTITAKTLELRDAGVLRSRDLSLEIPACDSVGDFLVLNNLIEDLTIAAN